MNNSKSKATTDRNGAASRQSSANGALESGGNGKSADAGTARALFQQRVGQAFLAMCRLDRYQAIPVGDLRALILQPLLEDRLAFAQRENEDAGAMPAGMALWASVSDEVSDRIAADANAGTFPVKLEAEDWTSGETVWLLDLIVPDAHAGTAVFMNFSKLVEGRSFRVHPVVWRMVDKSITDKFAGLKAAASPASN